MAFYCELLDIHGDIDTSYNGLDLLSCYLQSLQVLSLLPIKGKGSLSVFYNFNSRTDGIKAA